MWKKIKDENVKMIWVCSECKNKFVISPTFYQNNGTPVCDECSEDCNYLYTEIKTARKVKTERMVKAASKKD